MAALVFVALVSAGVMDRVTGADAAEAAAFYEGQRIKWIIPYSPGGGYDEYARLIAPVLSRYTGAVVEVHNLPGAGGMRGVNELYASPANGLVIGMINGSAMVTGELAGIEGALYRLEDFDYLGRIVADTRVLVLAKTSRYTTFEDFRSSDIPVKIGATGLGGSTYVDAVISKEAFNLNVEIVHGFDSSAIVRQAMLRGDIAGAWGSYGSAEEGVDTGEEIVILQSGSDRVSDLAGVPTAFEYAEGTRDPDRTREILTAWSSLSALGRSIAAPPGTPADRLAFLRLAFRQTMLDPGLAAAVEQAGRPLGYLDGEALAAITRQATDMQPRIRDLFVKAVRGEL